MNLYVIVDKVSYRWTFRNLHNRVGIGEETESRSKFSEKTEFWTEFFGQKTWVLNWWFDPRTTSLFIGEIYSQLGNLSIQTWNLKS